MKKILMVLMMLCLAQGVAFADDKNGDDGGKGMNFEERKAKVLEYIGKKRSHLDEHEKCVQAAGSHEDMKACRKKHKQAKEAMHAHKKEMKEKWKEKRKMHRKESN